MKSVSEYCKILGVDVTATPEQIKKAYRELVKEWHPDRFLHSPRLHSKAQEKLREINEAYDQLQSLDGNLRARGSEPSRESGMSPGASRRERRNTSRSRPGDASAAARNPQSADWHKQRLWLWRATLETIKDPWLITAFVLMLVLAVIFDWFYRPN